MSALASASVVVVVVASVAFVAAGFLVVASPPRDALPSPSLFLSPEELALSNAVPSVWAAEAFLLFCFFRRERKEQREEGE